jgi:hypothetical protein
MREEYDEVLGKIAELKVRKAELEKLMSDASDEFHVKVNFWWSNDDEGHHEWLIKYPLLRGLFDKRGHYNRHETMYLYDLVGGEDEFTTFLENGVNSEWFNMADYIKEYGPAIQEAIDNNMKSFVVDW